MASSVRRAPQAWMRTGTLVFAFVILLFSSVTPTQTAVAGKWVARSSLLNNTDLAFDLKSDGSRLLGTVSLGGGIPFKVDGTISGNTIEFSVPISVFTGPLVFTGIVNGEEIAFDVRRPAMGTQEPLKATRVSAFRGGALEWQLTVYDRAGNVVRRLGEPTYFNTSPVLSPDGRRLAVVQPGTPGGIDDIWVYDVEAGSRRRIQTGSGPSGPVWSPDGTQIGYYAYRQGRGGLYRKRADGTGSEQLVFRLPPGVSDGHLTDWSPDGRFLVFDTSAVVWIVPLDGKRPAVDLLRENYEVFGARFSPDTRFLAYVSSESGRYEVYVREFDPASARFTARGPWRVSTAGGEGMVHWRGDGRELTYLAPDGRVMAVDVSVPRFRAGSPRVLFRSPLTVSRVGIPNDDRNGRMSRDGSRFAFAAPPERKPITVGRETLAQYAGRYVDPGGAQVEVAVDGNQLLVPLRPGEEQVLPTSESSFFYRSPDADLDIDFVRGGDGSTTQMTVYRGGFGRTWVRTEAPPKPPVSQRAGTSSRRFALYDLQGRIVRMFGEPGNYTVGILSPNGTRVAFATQPGTGLWVMDVSTGAATRVTSESLRYPNVAWSPDGRHLVFLLQRNGFYGLYRKAADGTGREELLYRFAAGVADVYVNDWSSDGRFLAFSTGLPGVLQILPITRQRTPVELVREEFLAFGARFSPDNRFVAYVSNETGRNEIYVREFDASTAQFAPSPARRLSTDGGDGVVDWGPEGRVVYYLTKDGALMTTDATVGPETSSPRLQFRLPSPGAEGSLDRGTNASLGPDGVFLVRVAAVN